MFLQSYRIVPEIPTIVCKASVPCIREKPAINEPFIAIDDLLKNVPDVLLMPFQFTQPDFYNEYRSARNIVDTGGNRKAKKEKPTVA